MTDLPHMAQIGADEIPDCICGKGQTEFDPLQHKAVCQYGIWLQEGHTPSSMPTEPVEEQKSVGPVFHHCDCIGMMLHEAEGFIRESATFPPESRLNLLFLAQAEYLKQLAVRVKVRQRFIGAITDAGND